MEKRNRPTFTALNQLLSSHSILNSHRAKIDKNFSSICDNCQELEDVDHFVFHCGKYTTERNRLERTVEDILWREGCNDVTCIDLKLLGGYNENVSSNGQNELIAAHQVLAQILDIKADRTHTHKRYMSIAASERSTREKSTMSL